MTEWITVNKNIKNNFKKLLTEVVGRDIITIPTEVVGIKKEAV
ncbi:MAG: hypothetical protein ACYCWE_15205 [Eubacteriales bacterium]